MNTCRAHPESSGDRFCSPSTRPDLFPQADNIFQPWRPPPHPCKPTTSTYLTPGCSQDPSFAPDVRAKSTPPCDPPRLVHQVYPSPPLTDAALASTVPLPEVSGEPSEPRFHWSCREETVDENMSHDGARHTAPLSPPPTLLMGAKDLPADDWSKGSEHVVESWRYGEGLEDSGGPAPPFPPVRDDSGYEECGPQGSNEEGRRVDGTHGDRVMIEPTSVWIPHSPLSMSDTLPLADLPPLHGGASSGAFQDSIFAPVDFAPATDHLDRWGSDMDLEMSWSVSPSSTIVNDLSMPPSPKRGALSLDLPSFGRPLGYLPPSSPQHQSALISPLDVPFGTDHHWYGGDSFGEPSGQHTSHVAGSQQPFFTPFNFPLHPPSVDVDLESDYSDTVMPSEDEDSNLLTPSSPRRRTLNELHEVTPPHGDICLTPAPHSPHHGSFSLPDFDMEDLSAPPQSPHSPHLALPELEDEEMLPPPTEPHAPSMDTISPSLLGGAPPPEREGLGLFLQSVSIDPPLARSPSPDEDDLQFLDIQLDPASTHLEIGEFLQLRALRKSALQQERAMRQAEADYNDRVTAAAGALLPPAQTDADVAEKRARKRELHAAMEMRAEARRVRKLQKQRSKEIGALLDLKMQTPISPIDGFPPIVGGGKAWTRSIAHLVAHMVLRRRDRSRPLENKPPPDVLLPRASRLRASVSADDLLSLGESGDASVDVDADFDADADADSDMEE
ncbi:hypothetical protein C8Q79DRAFT_579900 [Trametes meyenii]|nr:hypothetical protein C8Q79DRAFT_579900 [Trametes meyenii]